MISFFFFELLLLLLQHVLWKTFAELFCWLYFFLLSLIAFAKKILKKSLYTLNLLWVIFEIFWRDSYKKLTFFNQLQSPLVTDTPYQLIPILHKMSLVLEKNDTHMRRWDNSETISRDTCMRRRRKDDYKRGRVEHFRHFHILIHGMIHVNFLHRIWPLRKSHHRKLNFQTKSYFHVLHLIFLLLPFLVINAKLFHVFSFPFTRS